MLGFAKYFNKYNLNKDKFVLKCMSGEQYKTDKISCSVENVAGRIYVHQTYTYDLSNNFVMNNLDKLRDEKILNLNLKKDIKGGDKYEE